MFGRSLLIMAAASVLVAELASAQVTLSGPTLGMFFDAQAQAIRPILGIPGSATAGQPINVGFPLAAGLISPSQDYALVVSAGSGTSGSANGSGASNGRGPRPILGHQRRFMSVVSFTASGPLVQILPQVTAIPDSIVMSPTGMSAALYYSHSASVEILTGLPNVTQTPVHVDLSTLPSAPQVFAVSDDGSLVLAGVSENTDGSAARGEVFLCTSTAVPRSVATVQHASAIAFVGQSHNAVLADDVSNSVTLISDVANAATTAWVFSSEQFQAPDSVQVSPDGQSFLAGSSTSGIIAILNASGSNPVLVACGCAPAEFWQLTAPSVYQITEPANGLLWLLDGQSPNPRVFFVPVPRTSPSGDADTSSTGGPK